jgi:hypothetical protein
VTRLEFDWDAEKAVANRAKHGVTFDEAMLVFDDPLALSRFDDRADEERWVTLGSTGSGQLMLVVHTHAQLNDDTIVVRIISARRPTRGEQRQYEEG